MSIRFLGNATKITLIRLQKHIIHVNNNIVLFVRDQEAMCEGDQRMMKRRKIHLTSFYNSTLTWAPMTWIECLTPSNTLVARTPKLPHTKNTPNGKRPHRHRLGVLANKQGMKCMSQICTTNMACIGRKQDPRTWERMWMGQSHGIIATRKLNIRSHAKALNSIPTNISMCRRRRTQ